MGNIDKAGLVFDSFQVIKTHFERNSIDTDYVVNVAINHGIQQGINPTQENFFSVAFLITITSNENEKGFSLTVEAYGIFHTVGSPTDLEYKNFLHVSAPSIMYPYLRAYISNFTLASGIKPIVLETMNFATQAKIE